MQIPQEEYKGVIEVLSRLYLEILEIETAFGLIFGAGDYRQRIEYFHDAMRAFLTQNPQEFEQGGRLSVEKLAYDAEALRFLSGKPLASLNPGSSNYAPGADVIHRDPKLPANVGPAAMDRQTKVRLGDLYQQYAVLFVALFKPMADNNFHERVDALNEDITLLSEVIAALNGRHSIQALQETIHHIHDPALRAELASMLQSGNRNSINEKASQAMHQAQAAAQSLDKAHTRYAMAQFSIFEGGKDIVKKLAGKGLNIAGQFVESAMQAARNERGRGGRS